MHFSCSTELRIYASCSTEFVNDNHLCLIFYLCYNLHFKLLFQQPSVGLHINIGQYFLHCTLLYIRMHIADYISQMTIVAHGLLLILIFFIHLYSLFYHK
jgi:hypothetical protein